MSEHIHKPTPQASTELSKEELVEQKARAYWHWNLVIIGVLLSIWALVSYIAGILLAVPLQQISIGSIPIGFWFAHQGAIITFILLILVYAVAMDYLDKKFDVHEENVAKREP